jgi:hypothetical protein
MKMMDLVNNRSSAHECIYTIYVVDKEAGIHAVISLQKIVGVTETRESAAKGWEKMSDSQRELTLSAYEVVFGKKVRSFAIFADGHQDAYMKASKYTSVCYDAILAVKVTNENSFSMVLN